jgi:excisionase family DNA binding protein
MVNSSPWMTRRQVAEYLGVTTQTIDDWRRDEGFPYVRVGRTVRFDRETLDIWLRARMDGTAAA